MYPDGIMFVSGKAQEGIIIQECRQILSELSEENKKKLLEKLKMMSDFNSLQIEEEGIQINALEFLLFYLNELKERIFHISDLVDEAAKRSAYGSLFD
jgi:hypothetical protein